MADLEAQIVELWEKRAELDPNDDGARTLVLEAVGLLDRGEARVAEIVDDEVVVHEWLRHAINLLFPLSGMTTIELGPFEYRDKLPLKRDYESQGVRVVPGGSARFGSFLEPGVILMPSYVNIGARVGAGTMVDTWATVGSCAQIGANVHLSGGVGIGGVLEPPGAIPNVIEDDCIIGSRSMITQGARVGRGTILGEGVLLNRSIPVFDAETGEEVARGSVPPYCIAMQSWVPQKFPGGEFGRPCVLIRRRLSEGERHDRTTLNAILRETGVNP